MNSVTFRDKTYTLDAFGFLHPPEQWSREFADQMARQLGIHQGLSEKHWTFIDYLRKKFLEEETVPVVVMACADNGVRLWEFRRLFPTGYHRGACKIAGINHDFMFQVNHWLTYEFSPVLRSRFRVTPTGFLEKFDDWHEDFAHAVVNEWNIEQGLTDRHREVILFLRRQFQAQSAIPTIFETCEAVNLSLEEIRELFPEGYRRGACRIAGLPYA